MESLPLCGGFPSQIPAPADVCLCWVYAAILRPLLENAPRGLGLCLPSSGQALTERLLVVCHLGTGVQR